MLLTKFRINWPFGPGQKAKNRFSRWPPWRPSWISDRNYFSYFFNCVTPMLPTKFRVNWPIGSEEKAKNRFSRWTPWQPSWTSNRNDFCSFFYLHVTPMPPIKFRVIWNSVHEKKIKIDFQDGHHGGQLGFPIGTILAIFIYVTPMLPTKFRVSWPFGSREEAKNRFSRWTPWQPLWISNLNDFCFFFIYMSPRCLLPSFESNGFRFMRRREK